MGQQEEKMLQKFLGEKKFLLAEFSKLIDLKEISYTLEELESIETSASKLLYDVKFCFLYNIYRRNYFKLY